jgi:hypothetical protein
MILTLLLFWFQSQTPLVERLYVNLGMESRLANFSSLLVQQYDQQFAEKPLPDAGKVRFNRMLSAFSADSLKRDATSAIRAKLDASMTRSIDVWLLDPATVKMHGLLKPGLDDDLADRIEELFASDDTVLNSMKRISLLMQLDERMRTSEIETMVIVNVYLKFISVMSPYLPEEDRISDEDVAEIAQLMFDDLFKAYQSANLARLAYLLKDVDDDDVLKFSDGYATPAGMWFADLGKSATEDVLAKLGDRIDAAL